MNKEEMQSVLLGEIDDVCKAKGLKYMLYGYTLLAYEKTGSIFGIDHAITIAMVQGEAEKLFKELERHTKENRYIKYSRKEDENYLSWGGEYGWRDTAYFNVSEANMDDYRGISVKIYYIEVVPDNEKKVNLCNRYLRLRKYRMLKYRRKVLSKKHRIKAALVCLFENDSSLASKYYKAKSEYGITRWEDINSESEVVINNKVINADMCINTEFKLIDGYNVIVPVEICRFLDCLNLKWPVSALPLGMVSDEIVGYDEIRDELAKRGITGKIQKYEVERAIIRKSTKADRIKIGELNIYVNSILKEGSDMS